MSYAGALTVLAGLSVSGVNHNYGIGQVPKRFSRASLPVLCLFPLLDELERQRVSGFSQLTVTGSNTLVRYYVTHMLLLAMPGANEYWDTDLIAIQAAYQAAITANPRLSDNLFAPVTYDVLAGDVEVNGVFYMGCRFMLLLQVDYSA